MTSRTLYIFGMSTLTSAPSGRHVRTPLATLGVLLILRLALLLSGGAVASGVLDAAAVPFAREWGILSANLYIVPIDLITIAVVVWLLRREGSSLGAMLGRLRGKDVLLGVAIGVGLLVALFAGQFLGNLLMYGGPPPVGQSWDPAFRMPLWYGLWCIAVMPITIALAEEVLYRGYLQPRWSDRIGGWPAMLLVSLFFGAQHIAFALSSPQAAFVRVLGTFLGGLLLAWLFRRTGRLWPLIIGHWLADVVGLGLGPLLMSLAGGAS